MGQRVWEHRCTVRGGQIVAIREDVCPWCNVAYSTQSVMQGLASVQLGVVGNEMGQAAKARSFDALRQIGDEEAKAKLMRLRDEFAMAAITGLMASAGEGEYDTEGVAKYSYQVADAMMKARG